MVNPDCPMGGVVCVACIEYVEDVESSWSTCMMH